MKRNNFLSYIIRFLEQKYMVSLHARFASAIPFSIVHSPFCITQVKHPCSALFPWSSNVDIWMLILPTVAKVNIALFCLQTLQKILHVTGSNSIQSNLLYHAYFHMLTIFSNGVKPGREVQPQMMMMSE